MTPASKALIFALLTITATWTPEVGEASTSAVSFKPTPQNFKKLADSIYLAEGGHRAKKPFGILSTRCRGYSGCRAVCHNTLRKNFKRWLSHSNRGQDFISFLGERYAPITAENDPSGLNHHWTKNVRHFMAHPDLNSRVLQSQSITRPKGGVKISKRGSRKRSVLKTRSKGRK